MFIVEFNNLSCWFSSCKETSMERVMMSMSARIKSKKKESSRRKQIGGGGGVCDGERWWLRRFRFERDNGTKPMLMRTTKARTKKVIGC